MPTFLLLVLACSSVVPGVEKSWASAEVELSSIQEANPDGTPGEFFSGIVQEFSDTSVSVSRTLPGKSAETRIFLLDGDTIIEGKLRKSARVTVGFRTHEGQDHAWRIIVRESPE